MAYRREDIEAVRAATDLAELVGEVTKLQRSGRSVMAVCPFHQEKAPSLSVDPARGLYHCFGCGKSGDLFRFVQEIHHLDFNDAVELLARRAGVPLHRDPEAARRKSRREALIGAVEKAVEFYHRRLRQAPDAAAARGYLRGRGYGTEQVAAYRLGYSPEGGDELVRSLRDEQIPEEVMLAAGLAARSRSGRLFDRFRDRVMFPIFDVRGDAVGFGARLLGGEGPKYLNSPDSAIYQKSYLLYGLNWAKSEIVRRGMAVVVEGYTDVIALAEAGRPLGVATCGTALGEGHLDLLRRFTERVVLMFDADEAGVEASLRGFERSVPGDLDLRVALLPAGRDPADLASAGETEAIEQAIAGARPLFEFRILNELGRFDYLHDRQAAARALNAVARLIALHPDQVARRELEAFTANKHISLDVPMVHDAVERARRQLAESPRPVVAEERLSGPEKAEQELLRLMLANDPGLRSVRIEEELLTRREHLAAYRLLAPVLAALDPGEPPDLGALLASPDAADVSGMLAALAMVERPLVEDAGEVVSRLQAAVLDRRMEELRRQLAEAERAPGGAPSSVLEELIALEHRRRDLRSPE
jgi:DNA primase